MNSLLNMNTMVSEERCLFLESLLMEVAISASRETIYHLEGGNVISNITCDAHKWIINALCSEHPSTWNKTD